MTIGYCEKCGQNTLLKREDLDICLAIILTIFTAGIGLIIYLAIWYSKEENRCVHCGSVVKAFQSSSSKAGNDNRDIFQEPIEKGKNPYRLSEKITNNNLEENIDKIVGIKAIYCPFCGSEIKDSLDFCPDCGMEL
ncbi:MAG: hypothetical protein ACQERB_09365 [Promethearchaeati archaeon]